MPGIDPYEKILRTHIARTNRAIKRIYNRAINSITFNISSIRYNGRLFALKNYPALQKKIERELEVMQKDMFAVVVNSIESSWSLSNTKNNLFVDQRLEGLQPSKAARKVLYDPNKKALLSFINRRENGLDLSDRVWYSLKPFRNELEQSIGFAIAEGKSAASTATSIKKYLNEPDKLFRRVRSKDGQLVLSKAAREYHPGRGVYRSSYKNALRVTRTENNIAYRTADFLRWNNMPFVVGFEVKLSDQHPRFDICDYLTGTYPKDFLFTGWHPQCLCYMVPVLSSQKDFEKLEDNILFGTPITNPASMIKKPPKGFGKWLKDNAERVENWKSKPYWMNDNKKYL